MSTKFQNIFINYERLERHYKSSILKLDNIALLDLAHTLRIWLDMKSLVDEYLLNYPLKNKFKSQSVSEKLKQAIGNNECVAAGLSEPAFTWDNNEELFHNPNGDIAKPFTASFLLMRDNVNRTHLKQFVLIDGVKISNKKDFDIINSVNSFNTTTYDNFSNWLGGEIIRLNFFNAENSIEKKIIPRGIFISRVANILGGSHPSENYESSNQFNNAINYLKKFTSAGLPLPYFLVLSVAKDILTNITIPDSTFNNNNNFYF